MPFLKSRVRFRAVVQARLESSRFPKKVLQPIGEWTILEHIARRVAELKEHKVELVFAVAEAQSDELENFLKEKGYHFFRGASYDVLRRFVDACADLADTDYVIRLTGDNPFIDTVQLGKLLLAAQKENFDYGYTAELPLGMGSEVIRVNALRSIWLRTHAPYPGGESGILPHHREHVTVFIRENPHLYAIFPLRLDESLPEKLAQARVAGIRLTVDEPADLEVCRAVFNHFVKLSRPFFTAEEVIRLAKNCPEIFLPNQAIKQKSAQSVDERAKAELS